MKYLNTYKLFESEFTKLFTDIKLDCEEILLELKDIGFDVRVRIEPAHWNKILIDSVVVEINNAKKFEKKDVEEYVYRLKDYLKTYNLTPMKYEILKQFGFGNDVPVGSPVFGQNQGIVFYWQLKINFYKKNI